MHIIKNCDVIVIFSLGITIMALLGGGEDTEEVGEASHAIFGSDMASAESSGASLLWSLVADRTFTPIPVLPSTFYLRYGATMQTILAHQKIGRHQAAEDLINVTFP